jgi:hypothetical protein
MFRPEEYYVLHSVIGKQMRYNYSMQVTRDESGRIIREECVDKEDGLHYTARCKDDLSDEEHERRFDEFLETGHIDNRPRIWNSEGLIHFLDICDNEGNFKSKNEDGVITPGKITFVQYIQTQDEEGLFLPNANTKIFTFVDYVILERPIKLKAMFQKME